MDIKRKCLEENVNAKDMASLLYTCSPGHLQRPGELFGQTGLINSKAREFYKEAEGLLTFKKSYIHKSLSEVWNFTVIELNTSIHVHYGVPEKCTARLHGIVRKTSQLFLSKAVEKTFSLSSFYAKQSLKMELGILFHNSPSLLWL